MAELAESPKQPARDQVKLCAQTTQEKENNKPKGFIYVLDLLHGYLN